MIVHLNQIPQGGTLYREEDLDPAFLDLEEVGARALSPVRCSLDIGASGSGVFATGSISIEIELTCVACLEPFRKTLSTDEFAAQIELEGRDFADLTPAIREDMLLLLPLHPRCDAEGTRNCPAKFQSAPGAPLKEEPDDASPAWNALDQLKPKK